MQEEIMTKEAKDMAEIEDVCWELFGGGCGHFDTLEEMQHCPRKIRTCDLYVVRFRKAVALLHAQDKKGAPAEAKPEAKSAAKSVDKPAEKAAPGTEPKAAAKATAKPTEAKPTEAKPTEAKPTEAKPTEAKPTEAKPTEAKVLDAPAAGSSAPVPVEGGIRFAFAGRAEKVEVAGSFTDWKPVPLDKHNGDASFSAVVPVPPGEHTYKLVVDGAWIKPPEAPAYAPDGQGGENGVLRI
jgi:hypothetical protein